MCELLRDRNLNAESLRIDLRLRLRISLVVQSLKECDISRRTDRIDTRGTTNLEIAALEKSRLQELHATARGSGTQDTTIHAESAQARYKLLTHRMSLCGNQSDQTIQLRRWRLTHGVPAPASDQLEVGRIEG
jgi:hypothetical protein